MMKSLSTPTTKPPRKRYLARTAVAAVAAGALTWLSLSGGASGATGPAAPVADKGPGSTVETYNYPGAAKILAEKKITLKRGDGHITLVDCASGSGFIALLARKQDDPICFKTTGSSGWLTLEIPAVHAILGNDYTTAVDMTLGSETKSFDINKNDWTGVGESGDPQHREYALVEIRTTK
ncbi:hypothetical protein ACFC0S_14910 [Streptomyces sp. NPDC056084]|uniref:hypothetical protein n=1 Tax=unclassified Streptomyces TaxID=2593676 RepID=UPI0035DD3C3D